MRTVQGALEYAGQQHKRISLPPSLKAQGATDWEGWCQAFVRSCYDIGPLFGSAWAQWNGADDEDKHVGGDPDDAPLGSALLYKGSGPNGHIMLAGRDFPRGASGAWSNDLVRTGKIDKVNRHAPVTQWAQGYLGYLVAVNDVNLPLATGGAARPKQTKRYAAIKTAIKNLEAAADVARRQHDVADRRALEVEIERLKKRYDQMRRA